MKMNKKKLVFDIETTGLNPLGSRITCICAKVIGGNEYRGSHTEINLVLTIRNL